MGTLETHKCYASDGIDLIGFNHKNPTFSLFVFGVRPQLVRFNAAPTITTFVRIRGFAVIS
jgi:hypothetical protein